MHIAEMQQKMEKKSFFSGIMAFEIVAEILHIDAGILVIAS